MRSCRILRQWNAGSFILHWKPICRADRHLGLNYSFLKQSYQCFFILYLCVNNADLTSLALPLPYHKTVLCSSDLPFPYLPSQKYAMRDLLFPQRSSEVWSRVDWKMLLGLPDGGRNLFRNVGRYLWQTRHHFPEDFNPRHQSSEYLKFRWRTTRLPEQLLVSGEVNCFEEFHVPCFAVRRKENVAADAFLARSENVTQKLSLFMKYKFRNPNQNAVWFHFNSLIKKPYCKVGWDTILCLELFLMLLTQELTPLWLML